MITGELKNKVDSIWDTIWTGGITSPITVLEQITYLIFMKLLDDNQLKAEDLKVLERILWKELGTKSEYEETTDIDNLAVFVRSLIGLSQEAINEKFGEFLDGNTLNAQQQEFVKSIINYVRENGDMCKEDLIEKSPFDNYDIIALFGENISSVLKIVSILHDSVNVAA